MTTPRPQASKKPFQSSTARMLKAFAAKGQDLTNLNTNNIDIKKEVVIVAAKAGQIRAATRYPDTTLTALGKTTDDLMARLLTPPETTTRISATMRDSLKSIHDQHQTTAMSLRNDQEKIEATRKRIFEAVTRSPISTDEIKKLEAETSKYFTEVEALEKKMKPFLNKVELQAINIAPSVQIPAEQRKLTN